VSISTPKGPKTCKPAMDTSKQHMPVTCSGCCCRLAHQERHIDSLHHGRDGWQWVAVADRDGGLDLKRNIVPACSSGSTTSSSSSHSSSSQIAATYSPTSNTHDIKDQAYAPPPLPV
jgi:hypothetical protein